MARIMSKLGGGGTTEGGDPAFAHLLQCCSMPYGLLTWHGNSPKENGRIFVPKLRQAELTRMHHEDKMAAHAGMSAVATAMSKRINWQNMARDIRHWIASCLTCQSRKPSQPKKHGLLQPFDFSVSQPRDDIVVDHIGPFPTTRDGLKYILIIICIFSRFVVGVPVRDAKAETTAEAIWNYWVCLWGLFKRLHSDNGTAFANQVMEKLASYFGSSNILSRRHSIPRKPIRGKIY